MRTSTVVTRRLTRRRVLAIIVIAIVVAAVGSATYVLTRPEVPLRLISLDVSLSAAVPDTPIVVTARAEGGSAMSPLSVELHFAAAIASGASGGVMMQDRGGGRFEAELAPFASGTEVWLFAFAYTHGQGPVFSNHIVFPVGTVTRGGPSGLAFAEVTQVPARPDSLDTVRLTARVGGTANVTDVRAAYFHFRMSFGFMSFSSSGGGGDSLILEESPRVYVTTFPNPSPGPGESFQEGTVWFYRLTAVDETGNTAATEVRTFTVA